MTRIYDELPPWHLSFAILGHRLVFPLSTCHRLLSPVITCHHLSSLFSAFHRPKLSRRDVSIVLTLLLHFRMVRIADPNRRLTARTPFLLCYKLPIGQHDYTPRMDDLIPKDRADIVDVYYEPLAQDDTNFVNVYFHYIPVSGRLLQKRKGSLAIHGILPDWIQEQPFLRQKMLAMRPMSKNDMESLATTHRLPSRHGSCTTASPQGLDTSEALLASFLATTSGPISAIAEAFRNAISLGNLRPLSLSTAFGSDCLEGPRLYRSEDCWFTKPNERTLVGAAIANVAHGEMRRRGDSCVVSGNAAFEMISDIFQCLSRPDPSNTPYAFNFPLPNDDTYAIRVPEEQKMRLRG